MQPSILQLDFAGLESEVAKVAAAFEQKETEDTWMQMDEALLRFIGVVNGSAHLVEFVPCARKLKAAIQLALATERTRLARTAMQLCEVLGESLRERFDGLADFIIPALLRLCTRANKVIVTSSNNALKSIINNSGIPSFLVMFAENITSISPSKTLRIASAECINALLVSNSVAKLDKYVESLESVIKCGTVDSTPEVRGLIKVTFEKYRDMFPMRIERFVSCLPEVAAKYLKVNKEQAAKKSMPARPRTGLALSAGPSRMQIGRVAALTPDNVSTAIAQAQETAEEVDDMVSLESETPSFEMEKHDDPAVKSMKIGALQRPVALSHTDSNLSRKLPERLTRDTVSHVTHLTDHAGGAQRVHIKPSFTPAGPGGAPKSKAMRVPTVAPAAEKTIDETSAKPISKDSSESTATKNKRLSQKHPSVRPTSSTSNKTLESIDFTSISNRLKNPDWALRQAALETLLQYITHAGSEGANSSVFVDFRNKAGKFFDCILIGLSDNQPKCVILALNCLDMLFASEFSTSEMVDGLIPKLSSIVFYQPSKTKQVVLERAQHVLLKVIEKFGIEVCALGCIHGINSPEYLKLVKIRAGCITMLAEMSDDEWSRVLSKSSNLKLYMTRLLSQASDSDTTIQKSLKACLSALHSVSPDAFWAAWSNSKSGEKKAVNNLFQTSDISFTKKELESAKKSNLCGISNLRSNALLTQKIRRIESPTKLPDTHNTPSLKELEPMETPIEIISTIENEITAADDSSNAVRSVEKDELSFSTYADYVPKDEGAPSVDKLETPKSESDSVDQLIAIVNVDLTKNEPIVSQRVLEDGSEKLHLDTFSTPQTSRGFSSKLPVGGSTSKATKTGIPRPSSQIGRIGYYTNPGLKNAATDTTELWPFGHRRNTIDISMLSESKSNYVSKVELQPQSPVASTPSRPRSSSHSSSLTRSISFGSTTVINDSGAEKMATIVTPVDVASETSWQVAVESGMNGLLQFAKDKRNSNILESHVNDIVSKVVTASKDPLSMSLPDIKCGLALLKLLMENFAMDLAAADICLAILNFESKSIESLDEQLDVEYEVDSVLATFKQTFEPKTLLMSVAYVLESSLLVRAKLCFEIASSALSEAKKIEGDGSDDVLFGGDSEMQSIYWDRILSHVAIGLSSPAADVRKAAFDLAVAMCARSGGSISNKLFVEVSQRSGRIREVIVKGMIERKLGRSC